MATKYKLVTQDYKTRKGQTNETTWKIGKTVTATGYIRQGLCSDAYIHCYDDPVLAVLLNPLHASIENPRMLVVDASGEHENDRGLKCGYRTVTPVKEVDPPHVITEQRITFAIMCAKEVYKGQEWCKWADKWLSGEDRSVDAANVAVYAARSAPDAIDATPDAIDAARSAAYAAYAARSTARSAAHAVFAADYAAYAADIDLIEIARNAVA